jgi:hypothetical protein
MNWLEKNKEKYKEVYQAILKLPVSPALEYKYGLLNNVIHLDIPVKNTDLKLQLNIIINDIMKMDIKEMSIDQDLFETEVKKFLIKELQKELE